MGSYHLHISGPILWAHQHVFLRSSKFSCMWKSTSCYSTHYYVSHLNYWHIAFPICLSVPFSSLSMSCTLHSVHWLLYWIHLNQSLCHYLENSCWILIMLLQHFLTLASHPARLFCITDVFKKRELYLLMKIFNLKQLWYAITWTLPYEIWGAAPPNQLI